MLNTFALNTHLHYIIVLHNYNEKQNYVDIISEHNVTPRPSTKSQGVCVARLSYYIIIVH